MKWTWNEHCKEIYMYMVCFNSKHIFLMRFNTLICTVVQDTCTGMYSKSVHIYIYIYLHINHGYCTVYGWPDLILLPPWSVFIIGVCILVFFHQWLIDFCGWKVLTFLVFTSDWSCWIWILTISYSFITHFIWLLSGLGFLFLLSDNSIQSVIYSYLVWITGIYPSETANSNLGSVVCCWEALKSFKSVRRDDSDVSTGTHMVTCTAGHAFCVPIIFRYLVWLKKS